MSQQGVLTQKSGTGANIETITGNSGGAVGPDGGFNINVVGTAPISVTGNPGTNTLTVAISGTGYVSSITGTANQIVASAATGAVTLSFPATAGISIGTYQATVAPVGGIIAPGPVGFGTNSVAADYGLLVSYNKVLQIGVTGTSTSTDTIAGSVSTYGIAANPTLNPAAGAAITGGIIVYPTHIAPNGQTITRAVGIFASGTAASNVGTITNQIGVYVDALGGAAGTVTNTYGGYFTNPGVGVNKCALYADNLSIGFAATTPVTNGMIVSGSAAFGANGLSNAGDGVSIGYTQSIAGASLFALDIRPTYTISSGSGSVVGSYVNMTAVATGTIASAYSSWLSTPAFLGTLANVTNYYGLRIDASNQAITNSTTLFVGQPTNAITNNICAAFAGGISIGASYTAVVPPSNGSIIQGQVAIGTNAVYSGGSSVTRLTVNMASTDTVGMVMTGIPTAVNAASSLYGYDMGPSFTPTNGATNVAGFYLEPIIIAPSTKTITTAAAIISTPFYSSNVGTITNAYSILVDSSAGAGTVSTMINLKVKMPIAGSTNYCAVFDGIVGIGANPTANTGLTITALSTNVAGLYVAGTNTNKIVGSAWGILVEQTINPTGGAAAYIAGISSHPTFISPSLQTVTVAAGIYTTSVFTSNVGTITTAAGVYIDTSTAGAGTITNAYGLYCQVPTAGSTNVCAYFVGGISVGYANTAPPSTGAIIQGQSAVGSNAAGTGARLYVASAATDTTCLSLGGSTMTSVDGSNNQYGMTSYNTFAPTNGATVVRAIDCGNFIIAPSTKTIAQASLIHLYGNWNSNVGTITTAAHIYIDSGSVGAGTITTAYGLYCATPICGTTNICAYFAGPIQFGTTTTGATTSTLGANCPGGATPATWITVNIGGTLRYVPCF